MAAWSAMRTICAPNRLCMAAINCETAFGATLNPNVTRGASGQRRVSASMSIRNCPFGLP